MGHAISFQKPIEMGSKISRAIITAFEEEDFLKVERDIQIGFEINNSRIKSDESEDVSPFFLFAKSMNFLT